MRPDGTGDNAEASENLYLVGGVALMVFGAGLIVTHPAVRKTLSAGLQAVFPDMKGSLFPDLRALAPDVQRYLKLRAM